MPPDLCLDLERALLQAKGAGATVNSFNGEVAEQDRNARGQACRRRMLKSPGLSGAAYL
jgi:hypothetical protein